jgi:hypothetical protein
VLQGVDSHGLLADRYRLDRRSHTAASGLALWRATDEVLDRTVAVHLVAGLTKAQAAQITAAAARAGAVPDARWVRVLDVGSETVDRRQRVWVVSEWVDGGTLTALIRRDPLKPPVAAALITTCAQAVAAAQQAGARHGALHPDEVLLPADGEPRLTGLELHPTMRETLRPATGTAPREYDDTRGLGALLFAMLTGRWPLPGWTGLPAVSRGDGFHPRQQRGSVNREIDDVTARALQGHFATAEAFLKALSPLPVAPLVPPPEIAEEPRRGWLKRTAWWAVPPILVAAIGVTGWVTGRDLGRVPGADRTVSPTFPQPEHHRGGAGRLVWSTPPKLTSFDPDGDGGEDPGGVGLAVDDDPSTAWSTDIYHGGPLFGGLKPGVGLLLDLGRAKQVTAARLLLSAAGADIQIRAGNTPPNQADDLALVGSGDNSPQQTRVALTRPTTARYWLLWITSLPRSGSDDYSLGVDEIALLR